jgi:hypothetical protein
LVNLFNITEDDIDINDIAHSLSLICRFNGHCKEFYSVAQHSVYVSLLLEETEKYLSEPKPNLCIWGLLHDAPEAYLGDIPSPIKSAERKYTEKRLLEVISKKLKLPKIDRMDLVHHADMVMLSTEKIDLMDINIKWNCIANITPWDLDVIKFSSIISKKVGKEHHILPVSPKYAKELFLKRFYDLLK